MYNIVQVYSYRGTQYVLQSPSIYYKHNPELKLKLEYKLKHFSEVQNYIKT